MSSNDRADFEGLPLFGEVSIEELAREYPQVVESFRNLDPVLAAAKFGALLVWPELQANCIRLEALGHLAMAYCTGQDAPSGQLVRESFDHLDQGYCGRMEDPAEDVFAVLVNTSKGNSRLFQGIRESPGFFLQRFLNVVETMPPHGQFRHIRESVDGLLKLSDAIAARASVNENTLGSEMPLAAFPAGLVDRLASASDLVRFTADEIALLGISTGSLSEFLFRLEDAPQLRNQIMGNSDLERRPIGFQNGCYFLLLPTAVSTAISRLIIEKVSSLGLAEQFESVLAAEYGMLFYRSAFLGKRLREPPLFEKITGGGIASVMAEVDPGRFLHAVFFVDGLDGFSRDGFGGMNVAPEALSAVVSSLLTRAALEAKQQAGFLDGLTLVVCCGYGRNFVLPLEDELPEAWRLQFVGAQDLNTLNWLHGFDALSIWRLLDARKAVEKRGVVLLNLNGLINLVAWARELDGHLIPHGQLPDEFGESGSNNVVVVHQNALRQLRYDVMTQWNPRRVLDPEGRWVGVLKVDVSPFEDDRRSPFYASEDDVHQGKLRGVYVAPIRSWWLEIITPNSAPKDSIFQHWTMLSVWLERSAPVLDSSYQSLSRSPISIRVSFEEIVGTTSGVVTPKSFVELRSLLTISADPAANKIELVVGRGFHEGFFQPENVGERALVEALVLGVAALSGESGDLTKANELVERICPDPRARQIHRFQARAFRDYAGQDVGDSPTLIDQLDDAAFRIGLGWKGRPRNSGANIVGVRECTSYLNDVVQVVLDELCALLQQLDRRSFIIDVIRNHESAARSRDIWKRTTQAVLALHDDKESTIRTIVEHHGRLNVCFTASRILIEAAICECPLRRGRAPGQMDLSRAMTLVMLAHHYGGWSDAIHWGAIEPYVRITPLGDVHIKHDFIDAVYEPFGRAVGEVSAHHDADSYPELYAPAKVLPSVSGVLESDFIDAWQAEFKVSIDGLRAFIRRLEDVEGEPVRAVQNYSLSVLIHVLADSAGISLTDASDCFDTLSLRPRPAWRVAERDVVDKDWFPWRFRRRLSVLRRPFVAVDSEDDPTIVVAPALIGDAIYAQMRSFHRGEVPSWQVRSREMLRWIGRANHLQRTAFNTEVAQRMRELGWEAEPEMKITEILRRSLDRNYGDVDVLAWRPSSGRVLAIECKDLQFNKTLGEIAEQLSDFRGVTNADGKRDALKRHLDRLEVLAAHRSEVSATLKLATPAQIEGHLVFKNPVPMRFAWERMAGRIKLSLFAELDQL